MDTTKLQPALMPAADAIVERAYEEHLLAVLAQLTSLTRDRTVAEDLAQEAFVRLTREVRADRTPDNIGGWLHRVAANLVTSRARRVRVAERYAPALADGQLGASPEDEAMRHERAGLILSALEGLSETDRAAVVMAAQGFRGPEIARTLRRTQAATRTLLCRARMKLRGRLVLADVA